MNEQPTDIRKLMAPFAAAVWAKVEALRALELKPSHRRRFSESISDDIKKASNLHPHKMSKRAREKALALAVPVNLADKVA